MQIRKKIYPFAVMISLVLPTFSGASETSSNAAVCYNSYGSTVVCPPVSVAETGNNEAGSEKAAIYRDNGNITITDLRNGKVWQKTGNTTAGIYSASSKYCADLALGTLSDWRIPDVDELQAIADDGRSQNVINPVFSCEMGNYWSATPHKNDEESYMTIGFFVTDSNAYPADAACFVRCIHGSK